MNLKRTLVKYTAALSIFFTGVSSISAATAYADEVSTGTVNMNDSMSDIVNANDSLSDIETTTPGVTTVKKTSAITKKRNAIVKLAKKEIGKPYVWGAAGPFAFDCSGLTSYVYKHAAHKTLPRTTYGQITRGKNIRVSTKKLKKGDLLFWGNHHVAIYIGRGKFVHAPAPGQKVKTQTLASFFPSSAKRVIG